MNTVTACCEKQMKVSRHLGPIVRFKRFKALVGGTNLLILALFSSIALIVPGYFPKSLAFIASAMATLLPFLVLTAAVAAYMKAAGVEPVFARIFSGHPATVIVVASLFGTLSPFCSCGVIPLVAALLASGVPLAGVMSFWLSSPVMSPDMFVLTAGGLGLEFAVVKTLATVSIGLLGGFATQILQEAGAFRNPLKKGVSGSQPRPDWASDQAGPLWKFWREAKRLTVFKQSLTGTTVFLAQWMVIAFALESLMVAYLPPETIGALMNPHSLFIVPLAALIGVPAYLNGYAAIPVAAGLLNSGFSAGAVLTFMAAGAMTSIPAMVAVFSIVKKSVFFWYLSLALMGSVLVGYAYQIYRAF